MNNDILLTSHKGKKVYYVCKHCSRITQGHRVLYDIIGIKPVCSKCKAEEMLFLNELLGGIE